MFESRKHCIRYAVVVVVVTAVGIGLERLLPEDSFLHSFLFRCWPIQLLNTYLFVIGVLFWFERLGFFKEEAAAFRRIPLPDFAITRGMAGGLIDTMPKKYRGTLTLSRFREIMQGLLHGEDVIRLNEELSRRDMAGVERGHLLLSNLRNIIPIVGFLGTVIGLSFGMIQFPNVADVVELREALKGFGGSLSVAFDTTLLALAYTIAIILLTSFLRQREEFLVSKVDERARTLIGRIRADVDSDPIGGSDSDGLREFVEAVQESLKQANETLGRMFDEISRGFRREPRFRLTVEPMEEKRDEE